MSAYAILGATGNIGGTVLEVLSRYRDKEIHCFVRSESKLMTQQPDICSFPNVKIFEGDLTNLDKLQACLRGTKAVFLAAAPSSNKPGTRVAQEQAEAVVASLERLRQEDGSTRLPNPIMLSSAEAEAETDFKFSLELPWLARKLLFAANCYVYMDLIEAEKYLRTKDWLKVVYFKPGGISRDIQRGHTVSEESQQTWISYLDVAAGMIECADDDRDRWTGKCVSVLSNGKAKFE